MDPNRFLLADNGRKDFRIPRIRCQLELRQALDKLSDGNLSRYCREVLISHVRNELKKGNPKLDDLTIIKRKNN